MILAMKLHELPIDALFVDHYDDLSGNGYQRDLRPAMVKKIVDHYNPDLDKPIDVSQRADGTYAIVDGQHRWEAKKKLGHETIRAWVYTERTVTWESGFFADNQTERSQMRPIERYRAELGALRPRAVRIAKVATKHGIRIRSSRASDGRATTAVSALERVFDLYGEAVLDDVLRIITTAWETELTEGLKNYYVAGLASFLNHHQENPYYSEERLIARIKGTGPHAVLQKATAIATINQYGGGGRNEHVRRGFEAVYNWRLLGKEKRLGKD